MVMIKMKNSLNMVGQILQYR